MFRIVPGVVTAVLTRHEPSWAFAIHDRDARLPIGARDGRAHQDIPRRHCCFRFWLPAWE